MTESIFLFAIIVATILCWLLVLHFCLPSQSHDESRGQFKGVFITPHRKWSNHKVQYKQILLS